MRAPEVCPNCGADVPQNAKSCPECGSDESTGWSEDTHVDGLDLPEENFDYDEFVDREFGKKKPIPHGIKPIWWIVAIVLLLVLTGAWVLFKYL
jgi:uncharacterized membrane protein YvbJ